MADASEVPSRPGLVRRAWRVLASPSARWSVLALLVTGILVGAAGVIGTAVMVETTGTVEFCGGACHSMKAFTLPEYKESVHFAGRTGVRATCADCHIPHGYPQKLWYKAKAGSRDLIQEARGVIATAGLYEKERWRMANAVWDEMKANDSANCRHCHAITPETVAKQKSAAQKMHKMVLEKKGTCIDCHKGVAHKEPEEPAQPAKTGALR
jgi:nitrate/TMAO reductase-like tetraheme cytochrome c subunit